MSQSRGARPRSLLGVERLEDRTVPAYLDNPGATIAIGDVLAGGGDEIVMGTGAGAGPVVSVYNRAGQLLKSFFAYDANMRQGVNVAVGDVDGNGSEDIITAPGPGGGPHVKVFDYNGNQLASFFAYDTNFRGGTQIAGGDLDGDGKAEIVTGPGPGGGPIVRSFDLTGRIKNTFVTFEPTFRGGANVAVGDVNGDGRNEVVTGAGVGGSPLVQVFSNTGARLNSFFAFDQDDRTGVSVATGDTNFSGPDEIFVARGAGTVPLVRGYTNTGTLVSEILATDANYSGGLNITVGDANSDRIDDVAVVLATGEYKQQPIVFGGNRNAVAGSNGIPLVNGVYGVDNNWTYYFPAGYTSTRNFPVMFLFDPAGNTADPLHGTYDAQVKQAADRLGIVVLTSRYFRSSLYGPLSDGGTLTMTYDSQGNIYAGQGYYTLLRQIRQVLQTINADQSRVIYGGFGEGGSIAHALNLLDPTIADGLLVDQGPVYGALIPNPPPAPNFTTNQYGPDWYNYGIDNIGRFYTQLFNSNSRLVDIQIRTLGSVFFEEVTRDFFGLYGSYVGTLFTTVLAPDQPQSSYLTYLTTMFNNPSWIFPP